ncbi:MAG: FAD-dependent oxidoreductase [Candidatus Yanofskybacteria bacterium]|nr:FAD-dependent oxidoreductase [Candidatus Yanofskybacteria bacterium]
MFDLIIIGGSAAATTAGIYAARRNLNFKIITKDFGGEVATSGEIANWPGIIKTDGIALAQQFRAHLDSYKVEIEEGVEVERITKMPDGTFCITTKTGAGLKMAAEKLTDSQEAPKVKYDYTTRAVLVTTGVHPRELNVPGEKEFRNKGVSYCTTCDGPLFKGKIVATIGGGNSALESALMLADIASKVYVINKNPEFKGDQVLIDNLKTKQNVEIIYDANTSEILGQEFVTGLKYTDKNGAAQEIKSEGIFIHIGMIPNSGLVPPEVEKNKFYEIVVNKNCETNIPGLYAAGDVTDVPFKQIVIAAGQGCVALLSAVQYLNRQT